MLLHPTLDKLKSLKLEGMRAALADQQALPDADASHRQPEYVVGAAAHRGWARG